MWLIIPLFFAALVWLYCKFPRLYLRHFGSRHHLPMGFSAEKFNYLLTPFLTILAVCTTYSAFHVQTQFNRFQMQKLKTERVEKVVFEFINMHSSMVGNMRVTDQTSGNRSFHFIYYEYVTLRGLLDTMLTRPKWTYLAGHPALRKRSPCLLFGTVTWASPK